MFANRTKLDDGWRLKKIVVDKLTNLSAADGQIRSFLFLRCSVEVAGTEGGVFVVFANRKKLDDAWKLK